MPLVAFRLSFALLCLVLTGCSGLAARYEDSGASVVVLVSDKSPAYVKVADVLAQRIRPAPRVYHLNANPVTADAVVRNAQAGNNVIVAVGLVAARAASTVRDRPVIFCQVFNYEVNRLLTSTARGVKATTPALKQFRIWKMLDPKLTHIGVVTGPNLDNLSKEAKTAAQQLGLTLTHVEVGSDKELFHAVKGMSPTVQGLWLAPDNRVLSQEVLRDVMNYCVREGKQVVVFSQQLLPWGALMSAESDHKDVAERVVRQIEAARKTGSHRTAMLPLERVYINVNTVVAQQLGLSVPSTLRGGQVAF